MSCNHLADCQRCGNTFEKLATDRDEWEQLAYRYQDERNTLAAHVEDLRKAGNRLCYAGGDHSDWTRTLMQGPPDSLARLKAKWQAEALEEAAIRAGSDGPWLRALARDYRRQSKGGE